MECKGPDVKNEDETYGGAWVVSSVVVVSSVDFLDERSSRLPGSLPVSYFDQWLNQTDSVHSVGLEIPDYLLTFT